MSIKYRLRPRFKKPRIPKRRIPRIKLNVRRTKPFKNFSTHGNWNRQGFRRWVNAKGEEITPKTTGLASYEIRNAPITHTPYTGLTSTRWPVRQRLNKSWQNIKQRWQNIQHKKAGYKRITNTGDVELAEFSNPYQQNRQPTPQYRTWLKQTRDQRRLAERIDLHKDKPDWSNPTRVDNPEYIHNLYNAQLESEIFNSHLPGMPYHEDNVMWNFDENEKKWFFLQNIQEERVEHDLLERPIRKWKTAEVRRYGTPSHEYLTRHAKRFNYKGNLKPDVHKYDETLGDIKGFITKQKKTTDAETWTKKGTNIKQSGEEVAKKLGEYDWTAARGVNALDEIAGQINPNPTLTTKQINQKIKELQQQIKVLKQFRNRPTKTETGLTLTPQATDEADEPNMADNTQQTGTAAGTNVSQHGATAQNSTTGAGANVNQAANRPFQNEDHQRFEKITRTYSRSYIVTIPIYTENTCEYFCNTGKKEVTNDGTTAWKTINNWAEETDATMGTKPKNYKPNNDDTVKIEWASPLSYIPYNRCAASMTSSDMREFENMALKYRVRNYGFELTGFQGHFEAPGVRPTQPRQGIPQNFQLLLNLDQDNSLTPLNISNSMEELDLDATWYKAQRKNIWERGTHNNAFTNPMPLNPQETILPRLIIGGEFPQKWLVENTQSDENIDWTKTTRTNMDPHILYDIYNDHESNVVVPDVDVAYMHENPSQQWILNGPMYERAGWKQKHEYPIPLRKQTWEKLSPKYAPIQTEIHSDWDVTRQRTQIRTQDVHTTTNLAYQFPEFAPICSLMVYPMYTAAQNTMTHTTGFVQARITYRAQVEMLVQNRIPLFPHFNPRMQFWNIHAHKNRAAFETKNDKATEDDRQQSMQSKFIPGDWPDQPSIKPTIFQADRHISVDLPGMNPQQAASATFVKPDPTYVSVTMDNDD